VLQSVETIAVRLAAAFRRHGVEIAFGQSIPSLFHLAAPAVGIRQVAYRQENSGGAMADAYARISNKVGVVTAQNGPAATLLVAPLGEALKASIAVVALVQDVPRNLADRNAFQDFDHVRMFDACAKWVRRVDRAERVDDFVDRAFAAATSGRPGPAVLLVPYDLLADAAGPPGPRRASLGHFPLDRPVADSARIAEAAALIAQADSPLLIAGGGAHISQACAELAALQESWHLPVATTSMGKGAVDESHPLSLGVVGYFMGDGSRTRDMKSLVERSDVIMLVGTRTNQNGTDSWTLLPSDARYIHLDASPDEVGRNYESIRLVGDAKATLTALATALDRHDRRKRAAARPALEVEIGSAVVAWRGLTADFCRDNRRPIRPEQVMRELDALIDADTIVVADASYASIWVANGLTSRRPGQRFLSPRGLAGLGWGLPFAIGAKIAAPQSSVICVAGDGAFAHTWAEMETVKRLRLPMVIIVFNNQILGYQKHAETVLFGGYTDACDFAPVDHAAIARACGLRGIRVEQPDQIRAALEDALACGEPVVLDVITDPDAYPPITAFQGKLPSPFA
jgi:acetolactate synthase I/II/III large subunit